MPFTNAPGGRVTNYAGGGTVRAGGAAWTASAPEAAPRVGSDAVAGPRVSRGRHGLSARLRVLRDRPIP